MQDPSLRLDALLADLDVPEDAIDVPRLAPTSPVARPRSRGSRAAKVRGRPSPNLNQTRFNAATGLPPGHLAPHVAPGSRQPLQARSSTLASTAHHNNSANSTNGTNGSNGHGHLNGNQHQQQPRRSTTAAQQAEQPQQSQRHHKEVSGQGRDFRHDHDAVSAAAAAAGAGAGAGGSHAPRRPEGSDSDVSEESPELPEELIKDTGDQLDVSSQSLDMALDMSVDLDR